MKVGLVTQWYDPEPGPPSLFGEMARELRRRGHDVKVVTGVPNYPEGKVYDGYRNRRKSVEVRDGLPVCRVGIYPSHDDSSVRRVLNYSSFGANALVSASSFLADRDAVWISNSPPTIAPLTRHLHRTGKRTVVHVMDIWPENIMSSGYVTSRAGQAMSAGVHAMNRMLFGNADQVMTIGLLVQDLLVERGVPREKMRYVPLWANETLFRPVDGARLRQEFGVPEDRVVLMYAGSLGAVQGLDRLIRSLAFVEPTVSRSLEVWILGDGSGRESVVKAIEGLPEGSPGVRLLGRRPMEEMATWAAASDIAYVGLVPDEHARMSAPSKVQTTMAMGKPILAAIPGEVDLLVRSRGLGFSVDGLNDRDLASGLGECVLLGREALGEIGAHARTTYESEFSLAVGVDRIEAALSMDATG